MYLQKKKKIFYDENEDIITKKLYNLLFINSRRFIEFIVKIINNYDNISEVDFNNEEKLMLNMMYYIFYNDSPNKVGVSSINEGINKLLSNKTMMKEVRDILSYNYKHIEFIDKKVDLGLIVL